MPRRLHLENHFEVDELEELYKSCKDPVEKPHWQMIWLVAKGKNALQIAEVTGVGPEWVRTLVKRYNQLGAAGLRDRRKDNGRDPLIDEQQQQELAQLLSKPHPEGGLWNGPKVAAWLSQKVGRKVPAKRGWIYLKRLGFSLRRPRRRHSEADEDEQECFQKP